MVVQTGQFANESGIGAGPEACSDRRKLVLQEQAVLRTAARPTRKRSRPRTNNEPFGIKPSRLSHPDLLQRRPPMSGVRN